ncbi:hypothetical protein Tco_0012824 [Tanacetum coccineum]
MKLAIGRLVNGSSCDRINMVIKDLDLEPKVDAMMREFLDSSWWKELSVGLDPRTKVRGMSIRFAPADGVEWERYHVVPYGELNGILVALVARFGVISKSTDRIRVSYGG